MTIKKFALFILISTVTLRADDWPMYLLDLGHSSFNASEQALSINSVARLRPSWTYSAGATVSSAVTLTNGVLYFGDWSGSFVAVDAEQGTLLWKTFVGTASRSADSSCSSALGVSAQATVIGNTVYVPGG